MSEPLRTVHINTERTWRGGEQQTLYLAAGLDRRGHGVEVIAQPGSPLEERARQAGLSVSPISMRGEGDVFAVAKIAKVLKRVRAQIVHMHTSHAHTLGCLASKTSGMGLRIVSRRVDFTIFRNRLKLSRFKYGRWVDRYIAISKAVRGALIKDGIDGGRISIVHSGIDLDRHRVPSPEQITRARRALREELGVPESTPLVLNLAHFGWHKAQEVLARATPFLREEIPEALVLFVGEGELMGKVRDEVEALGMQDSVRFLGFRKDVEVLIDASDVFVMCSVMEGLCTSILDSLARQRVVVASEVGGIPEIVEDGTNGSLVPPREPEKLAVAILNVLKNPERAAEMGRRGREKVEAKFSVDSMVEGTLGVYRGMLGQVTSVEEGQVVS